MLISDFRKYIDILIRLQTDNGGENIAPGKNSEASLLTREEALALLRKVAPDSVAWDSICPEMKDGVFAIIENSRFSFYNSSVCREECEMRVQWRRVADFGGRNWCIF